ncbi:MAG: amidohydrolase [Candidatus Marinimicrobia bacterium]|nr:amidohydrolase [Candidatus Neomarinimicrobiota bacterium]
MKFKNIFPMIVLLCSCSSIDPVEKLYLNGSIWTGDEDNPRASAIIVRGEKIVFVGSDTQALSMVNENAEQIDLQGKFVTPGLIDNHVHFITGGMQLSQVNLYDVSSKEEFQKRVLETDNLLPKGKWMVGGNWDHEKWGGNYPDRSWIDEVAMDRPVLLDRLDGHMALANGKALLLANITERTNDPDGGIVQKDGSGYPTGILKDNAIGLCSNLIPDDSKEELDQALERAMDQALSMGITQVHDMGSWEDLETYQRCLDNGDLKIRVKLFTWYSNWRDILSYVKENGPGGDWLKWDGIKGMMDGSLGSRTAWMNRPYLPDHGGSSSKEALPTVGILTIEDTSSFKTLLRETDKANIQHAVHAIGDKANDWILDEFAKIRSENGERDRRSRIEHAQHLSPTAIDRFSKENIIPSMQPYHLFDDGSWAHKRIERDLLSRTYVFKSLLDRGANLTFGSDWTVAPLDPMTGIYAAVTRRTRDDRNSDGWFPKEKISTEEALRCYTINNAYAAFWDSTTGSISVGKNADFVVHSHDLLTISPEQIIKSKVLRTVVGGRDHLFEL